MYFSAKEMLAQLDGTDKKISDLVIENEIEIFATTRQEIMDKLEERYQIMYQDIHEALDKEIRSLSGLTGGSAKKMWQYYQSGIAICDETLIRGVAYALSCLEVNSSMGLIVAAPTAGACGILPGSLFTVAEKYDIPHEKFLEALATSSGIGQLIIKMLPFPAQKAAVRLSAEVLLLWLPALSLKCWAALPVRHWMLLLSQSRTSWALCVTLLPVWWKCHAPRETLPV